MSNNRTKVGLSSRLFMSFKNNLQKILYDACLISLKLKNFNYFYFVAIPDITPAKEALMRLNAIFFYIILSICVLQINHLHAQSYSFWTQSFNEESSLLSGAVVAGGSGPSAIYYNPAAIVAGGKSMFSINASLFTVDFYNLQNALGEGIDLESSNFLIQPRFISLLVQPKWNENISMELALFNNESYEITLQNAVDKNIDILQHLPGPERYYTYFQFRNKYRDDWLGVGAAWKISPEFLMGLSWYGSIKSLRYEQDVDIEAMHLSDTVYIGAEPIPFYSATFQQSNQVKFNDYRMSLKLGLLYTKPRFSFGFTFKTPSLRVYSDGKKVLRKEKQANIMTEDGVDFMPNYTIVDSKEKEEVTTNFKDPLSVALGIMLNSQDQTKTGFLTAEFFGWIDPYKIVYAPINPFIASSGAFESLNNPDDWLSFVHAAKPIMNVAIGYRQKIAENLLLMGGFKTDLNYRKGVDYKSYSHINKMQALELNIFHISTGIRLNIKNHELITGLNYAFGVEHGRTQFANFADPVEYNASEGRALQGTRQNNVRARYNSISLYFGANLSFMQ